MKIPLSEIPGSFVDKRTEDIRFERKPNYRHMKHYRAVTFDGILMVFVAQEPDDDGTKLWHLSMSHRVITLQGEKFIRCPSWDELKLAKYLLVPEDVPMSLVLPSIRKVKPGPGYVNVHSTTLHLWQCDESEEY